MSPRRAAHSSERGFPTRAALRTTFPPRQSEDSASRALTLSSPPFLPPSPNESLQVAVQISTKTCGPCKVVYPHFAGLSEELPDVTFVKIMGDHDQDTRALMKEWGVRVVPLFFLFRNGEKIGEWSGAKPDVLRENVLEACTEAEKASMVSA